MLADGTIFLPGKPLQKALPKLRREQKRMSRKFEARKRVFHAYHQAFVALGLHGPLPERNHLPLSHRLQRQIRRVAQCHTKVECTRRDDLRKAARTIEQQYRLVGVEEHSTEFMRRNRRTSRAVSDVAPGLFKQCLKHALGPDRYIGGGTSRPGIGGNSQTCLCGEPVPKTLKDRWHECPACGLSGPRCGQRQHRHGAGDGLFNPWGDDAPGARAGLRQTCRRRAPSRATGDGLVGNSDRASCEASILTRPKAGASHHGCASYRGSQ